MSEPYVLEALYAFLCFRKARVIPGPLFLFPRFLGTLSILKQFVVIGRSDQHCEGGFASCLSREASFQPAPLFYLQLSWVALSKRKKFFMGGEASSSKHEIAIINQDQMMLNQLSFVFNVTTCFYLNFGLELSLCPKRRVAMKASRGNWDFDEEKENGSRAQESDWKQTCRVFF